MAKGVGPTIPPLWWSDWQLLADEKIRVSFLLRVCPWYVDCGRPQIQEYFTAHILVLKGFEGNSLIQGLVVLGVVSRMTIRKMHCMKFETFN